MRLTVNDFRRMNYNPGDSVCLDSNPQLAWGQRRCIRQCHSVLHRVPIIRQLPCLRQQRFDQHILKSRLLVAIAQEYGSTAVHSLNHYPHYWAGHKILSGRKINRLLQIIDHTYQPLGESVALPRFITDELLPPSQHEEVAAPRENASRSNRITSGSRADSQERRLQKQIEAFLLSDPANQTEARQQLHQALTQDQISDERYQPFLALSSSQRLRLYGFMAAYRRLPSSRCQRALPLDRANRAACRPGSPTPFSSLAVVKQLSILGEAAASRTGYRRKIDVNTQQLLSAKGVSTFSSYYSRGLENQLTHSDPKLRFMGDHLYSSLGLSAHLIARDQPQGSELSLVFGGFKSHPTLLGKLNQARAILNNFFHLPWTAPLYREAAELAQQAAQQARQQGFTTFTVSGHSLGGSLAEYAVGQYPDLIHQARVFQAFHVMGSHRRALIHNPSAQQKIMSVEVKNDWVTSPLVHRRLRQIRTVTLQPRRYDQSVHGKYDRRLFKAVLYNLSTLSTPQAAAAPAG